MTCSQAGCQRPHRAKGLCSTHYNQAYQPERHPQVRRTCETCGETSATWGPSFQPPQSVVPQDHPARWIGSTSPVFLRDCNACGGPIAARSARQVYCGRKCQDRARDLRRAGRHRGRRVEILERDGWWCWLCQGAINPLLRVPHPLAGTVDHLEPRSTGGGDEDDNLAAAHMSCNSRRGASLSKINLHPPS